MELLNLALHCLAGFAAGVALALVWATFQAVTRIERRLGAVEAELQAQRWRLPDEAERWR